jgi:hypothetical protein
VSIIIVLSLALPGTLAAQPAAANTEAVEWVVEEGSSLLLRVVMEERGKPCGAVLTVDPTRRRVRVEGIPGEVGCRRVLDGSFSEVKTLRRLRGVAGFMLEIAMDAKKEDRLVLLPLPHF